MNPVEFLWHYCEGSDLPPYKKIIRVGVEFAGGQIFWDQRRGYYVTILTGSSDTFLTKDPVVAIDHVVNSLTADLGLPQSTPDW